MMRMLIACLLMCTAASAQATYSGSGRSSGSVTYQTRGTPGGGGGVQTNENFYCPPGVAPELTEQTTPTWGVSDGAALLPVNCMNTALTSTPSPGSIIPVAAADNAGFQTALNSAACGQTITLAQNSTYTGTFTLPAHGCTGVQWITIRSTGVTDPNFPAEGVRATPCIIGLTNDAVNGYNVPGYPSYAPTLAGCPVLSAKIVSPGGSGNLPAINTAVSADHYRFIGIEITKTIGVQTSQLVVLNTGDKTQVGGLGANHVIFDRCIVHGEQWLPTSDVGSELQAGIDANNTRWVAFINGWIYDTYCNSSCIDSQGYKAGTGFSQDGPHKLWNNMLTSAGETWLFGGGGQGSGTPTPANFEARGNFSMKPLTWMVPIETCVLYVQTIPKNLSEFKNMTYALMEGNSFQNSWQGCQSDQSGYAVLLNPGSQNNHLGMTVTYDGTSVATTTGNFTHNTSSSSPLAGNPVDAANCPPLGCIIEDTVSNVSYRFCNGSNGCTQSGVSGLKCGSGVNAGLACTVDGDCPASFCAPTTSARLSDGHNPISVPAATHAVNACVPGDCPGCKNQHITFRFNEIYNVTNGLQINTGLSSHCRDQAAGMSNVSIHDNRIIALSRQMSNGVDPNGSASAFVMSNNSLPPAVQKFIDIVHNTVAVETGNPVGVSGFGNQVDRSDIQYMQGIHIHDNVSPASWSISRGAGSNVTKGIGGLGGLANTYAVNSCQRYFTVEAPDGLILADGTQNFTFSAIPGGTNYLVSFNGQYTAIVNQTATSFTVSAATSANDTLVVRDLSDCDWIFASNLLGAGVSANFQGAGQPQAPYPSGPPIAPLGGISDVCGTSNCILTEVPATPGTFINNFINWGTGRNGNFAIAPISPYLNKASDAATRVATGKSPGADMTLLNQFLSSTAPAVFNPQLTITSGTLTPAATHDIAYANFLTTTNGASQNWQGFRSWFLATDPATCGGDCGVLPSTSGIIIGRGGTVNGPFSVLSIKRAIQACGSAGTVACSTVTVSQTIVAGLWQVGQKVTLSNFENGTGSSINDGTFNGTCTIRLTGSNTFSCEQVSTGADTITSHSPNSFWKNSWKKGTTCTPATNAGCYQLGEQVIYLLPPGTPNHLTYVSLQNNNVGHQPDISPTFWGLFPLPNNSTTGALVTFAPMCSGACPSTYTWWLGVRDGAFQTAYAQIMLTVN